MPHSGPCADRIRAMLAEIEADAASGSLRLTGTDLTGSLFFNSGHVYFAVIDGRSLTASELRGSGIDHVMWQEAGSRPGARGHFAEELISLGCPRDAIERFVTSRVMALVDGLAAGPDLEMARGNGRHGFGTAVSLPAGRFLGPGSVTYPDELLISLSRCQGPDLTLDASVWNGIVSLIAPLRFAELVESIGAPAATALVQGLEAHHLVSLVDGSPPAGTGSEKVHEEIADHRGMRELPSRPSPFDHGEDDEYEEYVPERVGRQAYAAMASMRASAAEPPPQERVHALRRLIEAVRGL